MKQAGDVWAVIMAGGSGTRFWPASRALRPKQLLPLLGDSADGRSLLAATFDRLAPLVPPERTVVVTARTLIEATRAELPMLPAGNFLAEPEPRNTAPCIGWATRTIAMRDRDAVIAVLPSDHHVADRPAFLESITSALQAARTRDLATIGIRPTRADTGFGYIEIGGDIPGLHAREVVRFVEKPDLAKAHAFLESGRFLWNSGMFFFRARAMDEAIAAHLPDIARGLDRIAAEPVSLGPVFASFPSISIDYGVVEHIAKHAGHVAVVTGDFGWSDVGSWESAWELAPKDTAGNALPHGAVVVDARGNLVRAAGHKVVALVGVEDLVVVETDDALLVIPRGRAQEVRAVVDALKATGRTDQT